MNPTQIKELAHELTDELLSFGVDRHAIERMIHRIVKEADHEEERTQPLRVVNLYAGPGTGKSTTAAALFAELKYRGYNTEMILEYAKDATWERRGPKVFQAQEYIFGKQHFRMARVVDEVDFVITDSPILLGLIYMPENFYLPTLKETIKEAYDRYENIDIFLKRNKPYNPSGRNQTSDEAKVIDGRIKTMLSDFEIPFVELDFGRENVDQIIEIMKQKEWI